MDLIKSAVLCLLLTLTGAWARHTVTAAHPGADGVALMDLNNDGKEDIVTAWEAGGAVTAATAPSCVATNPWLTQSFTGMGGAEDAKPGAAGIAVASDGGMRLYFIPYLGQPVEIASSLGHGRWMQVTWGDIDLDGLEDIVAVGRTTGAVMAWFKAPDWTYNKISDAGWGMTLDVRDIDLDGDLDVFLTDRAKIGTSWALYGARWSQNGFAGQVWTNHPISVAGGCATCTPGDEMMGTLIDFSGDGTPDLVHCQSSEFKPNRVVLQENTAMWGPPATWLMTILPNPSFAHGHCQHANMADLNLDGRLDVIVSTWESNALPPSAASGVYVLYKQANGTWLAEDISGPVGTKFDNILPTDIDGDGDLDLVTTEEVEGLGVIWYENPVL